jgi:hypothetical protein
MTHGNAPLLAEKRTRVAGKSSHQKPVLFRHGSATGPLQLAGNRPGFHQKSYLRPSLHRPTNDRVLSLSLVDLSLSPDLSLFLSWHLTLSAESLSLSDLSLSPHLSLSNSRSLSLLTSLSLFSHPSLCSSQVKEQKKKEEKKKLIKKKTTCCASCGIFLFFFSTTY